jgi:hypothetical protein
MKRSIFIIYGALTLLNSSCFVRCDCYDGCQKQLNVSFDSDSINGFSVSEIDTVYFFSLNKSDSSIVDSMCLKNGEFGESGIVCSDRYHLALTECENNFLLITKNGYSYLISDILITAAYTGGICDCIKDVKRSFKINGIKYEVNGMGEYNSPHFYLKKYELKK